jgi:ribokinase
VIGSANLDFTLALPRLPRAGETVSGGTLLVNRGGKGANQAVAARQLGAEVRMVGAVGADRSGMEIREGLQSLGLNVDGLVALPDVATGTALIFVDHAGTNQIGVAPGANHRLTVDLVKHHEDAVAWADVVLCQLETPLDVVRWALETARRHGVTTVLNPAPARELSDAILALADYVTPNEIEAGGLSGVPVGDPESPQRAAQALVARGARRAIVTLGERGSLYCDGRDTLQFPAFPVTAVDTTAAGDAFNGALAVGLAAGGRIDQVIPLAAAAAALTCTKRGAQAALPTRDEVERFLERLRGPQVPTQPGSPDL